MIKSVLFKGKPAYKISATLITKLDKASLYDCEGDERWIPNSVCKYNAQDKSLVIIEWFYNKIEW